MDDTTAINSFYGPALVPWATISDCGLYRYALGRAWCYGIGNVVFVMLNPSKATAEITDPTASRIVSFAKLWGFQSVTIVNAFGLRATDPKELYTHRDPVGPLNDRYILDHCQKADKIICAWGKHASFKRRDREVLSLLKDLPLHYLKLNKDSSPGHPLYIKGDTLPTEWTMK